jgi:hypothetical protein
MARGLFMVRNDRAANADWMDAKLNIEPTENADISEASEANEPIDTIEPAEPIDKMDPEEPMDRIEPVEPIDRIDPEEPMLSSEPPLLPWLLARIFPWPAFFAMRALCLAGRSGGMSAAADKTGA